MELSSKSDDKQETSKFDQARLSQSFGYQTPFKELMSGLDQTSSTGHLKMLLRAECEIYNPFCW
jgi:hypothetical protein